MKKYVCLAALIALAGLSVFAQPSEARARFPLNWQHSNGFGSYNTDSTFKRAGGATWGASTAGDTTVSFRAPPLPGLGVAATDTVSWFTFSFTPSGKNTPLGLTAGADSIYLALQASFNGIDWEPVTPGTVFLAANLMPTPVNAISAILLERGTTNQFFCNFFVGNLTGKIVTPAVGATTAATYLQIGAHQFFRFIVTGDYTGAFEGWVEVLN